MIMHWREVLWFCAIFCKKYQNSEDSKGSVHLHVITKRNQYTEKSRTARHYKHSLCLELTKTQQTLPIHSFAFINWCNASTGPTVRAVLTMLAGSQTGLLAQAPFSQSSTQTLRAPSSCWNVNPRFSCVCYGCAGLSVNTQRCHNVAITAGRYFNNNLFGQLQLHH